MQWLDGGYESAMADGELGFKETSGSDPLVRVPELVSVEKTHSQFENTTVGNFETLEETSGAGPSFKINRISYPG